LSCTNYKRTRKCRPVRCNAKLGRGYGQHGAAGFNNDRAAIRVLERAVQRAGHASSRHVDGFAGWSVCNHGDGFLFITNTYSFYLHYGCVLFIKTFCLCLVLDEHGLDPNTRFVYYYTRTAGVVGAGLTARASVNCDEETCERENRSNVQQEFHKVKVASTRYENPRPYTKYKSRKPHPAPAAARAGGRAHAAFV